MAKLPDVTTFGDRPTPQPGGRRSTIAMPGGENVVAPIRRAAAAQASFASQAGQGTEALAGAAFKFAAVNERLLQQRRAVEVDSAVTRAAADMKVFVLDLKNDPDVETYGKRFEERAKKVFEAHSKNLDPQGLTAFQAKYDSLLLDQALKVRELGNLKLIDQSVARLDQTLEETAQLAAQASSKSEYDKLILHGTESVEKMVQAGMLTAVEGGERIRGFQGRLDEVKVMQEISANPDRAVEMLSDPRMFANIDPKRRQSLLDSAVSRADIAMRRRIALSERQDRQAAARMKAEGDALLKEVYDQLDQGGTPSREQLDRLKNHDGVSPSEYHGLLTSIENAGTVEDDPDTVAFLQERLHMEDISRDLKAALDEKKIKPETYRTMFNQNKSALSDNRPSSPFKSGREFVRVALDPGQIGGDPITQQPFRIAQQSALDDFDTWFEANPGVTRGQAMEQARIIMQRYQVVAFDQMRLALPRPRGYTGSKQGVTLEAVEAARDALAAEIKAGRLTDEMAAREIEQLNVWERILSGTPK